MDAAGSSSGVPHPRKELTPAPGKEFFPGASAFYIIAGKQLPAQRCGGVVSE